MKFKKEEFTIGVFEDNPIVVIGLSSYLKSIPNYSFEVIFSSSNPQDFLSHCIAHKPDFLIVDIISDKTFGLELFEQIFSKNKNEIILAYTNVKSRKIIKTLISMGVAAFIPKKDKLSSFEDAFDLIIKKGKVYLPPYLESLIDDNEIPIVLTEMEKKIIPFLLKGYSSKLIAEEFFVTSNAIDFHRKNLFSKFEVNNIASFVKEAIAQGYSRGINF